LPTNLVIDPGFTEPADWCSGSTSWPVQAQYGIGTDSKSHIGNVSGTYLYVECDFDSTSGLRFVAATASEAGGGIAVTAGQVIDFAIFASVPTLSAGTPYFGLLDQSGNVVASVNLTATSKLAQFSGRYTVAAGVTAIRPIISLSGCQASPTLTTTTWKANSAPSTVTPTDAGNGYLYSPTAGTTSGSPPSWPTQFGQTVVDGTVTWTCTGRAAAVFGFVEPSIMVEGS